MYQSLERTGMIDLQRLHDDTVECSVFWAKTGEGSLTVCNISQAKSQMHLIFHKPLNLIVLQSISGFKNVPHIKVPHIEMLFLCCKLNVEHPLVFIVSQFDTVTRNSAFISVRIEEHRLSALAKKFEEGLVKFLLSHFVLVKFFL